MSTLIGELSLVTRAFALPNGFGVAIGLSIRVRLLRSLPHRFKVDIRVKPGSHQSEHAGKYFTVGPVENHLLILVVQSE